MIEQRFLDYCWYDNNIYTDKGENIPEDRFPFSCPYIEDYHFARAVVVNKIKKIRYDIPMITTLCKALSIRMLVIPFLVDQNGSALPPYALAVYVHKDDSDSFRSACYALEDSGYNVDAAIKEYKGLYGAE